MLSNRLASLDLIRIDMLMIFAPIRLQILRNDFQILCTIFQE